jgi:hypothetical protein
MDASIFLAATLLALASGPVLYAPAAARPRLHAFLDGFVMVGITLLIVADVLPETYRQGGWLSLAFAAIGLFGPTLLERFRAARAPVHLGAVGLAMGGLVVHALGDGVALAPTAATPWGLQLAVPLHTIPVSMAVWSVLVPASGTRAALAALAAMAAATVAGYFYGVPLSRWLGEEGWAWLQALIAGSILHVIFGRPHLEGADHAH